MASAVGQHQASRAASVPRTTLHRWLVAMQHSSNPLRRGHPTLLDLESERRLVALALTRQALNCPLTKPALGLLAAAVAKAQDKKFATANGEPSEDWWHGFLKRWPALVARSTSRLSSDSLVRPTEERLVPWFELVKTIQAASAGSTLTNCSAVVIQRRSSSRAEASMCTLQNLATRDTSRSFLVFRRRVRFWRHFSSFKAKQPRSICSKAGPRKLRSLSQVHQPTMRSCHSLVVCPLQILDG